MKIKYILTFIFIVLILSITYIKTLPYKIIENGHNLNKCNSDIIPHIIISPGGRYGMYNLGICHYLKNHFDLTNKKILGFSAGSWNALFMSIKKEYMNDLLKKAFKLNKESVPTMLKKTIKYIEEYKIEDFDVDNLYIATATLNKTVIYNKFLSIDQVVRCCTSSSFIPFFTYYDIFYFYKHRLTFDGGLHYKKYLKSLNKKISIEPMPLIITFKMFGSCKHVNIFRERLKKYKPSAYQLYIKGYHDAKKNHFYFEKYFK